METSDGGAGNYRRSVERGFVQVSDDKRFDNDKCAETVTRGLMYCPESRSTRRKLRSEFGDTYGSVSNLVGGSTEGPEGEPVTVARLRTVQYSLRGYIVGEDYY